MGRQQFCHACGDGPYERIITHYKGCEPAQRFMETDYERNLAQDARRVARRQARERALRQEAENNRLAQERLDAERRAHIEVRQDIWQIYQVIWLKQTRPNTHAIPLSHPLAPVELDVNNACLRGFRTWSRRPSHNSPSTCLVSPNTFPSRPRPQSLIISLLCPKHHLLLPPYSTQCCHLTGRICQ